MPEASEYSEARGQMPEPDARCQSQKPEPDARCQKSSVPEIQKPDTDNSEVQIVRCNMSVPDDSDQLHK